MKKLILILVALVIAAPCVAGTITFGAVDNGGGTCTLTYYVTGAVAPVAMGLLIEVDGGKTINDVTDIDEFFEIYMDAAYSMDPCYTYGDGTPIADPCGPGEIALPQNRFVISMGGLGGPTSPPTKFPKTGSKKDPATLCVLHADTALGNTGVTTTGTISICPLRGGVIDEDAEVMDPNSEDSPEALALPFTITEDCYPFAHVNQNDPCDLDYATWVAVGNPLCWCSAAIQTAPVTAYLGSDYQCRGDADGLSEGRGLNEKFVVLADNNLLVAAYQKTVGGVEPVGPYWEDNKDEWICADFDHKSEGRGLNEKWVTLADSNILVTYYQTVVGGLTTCFP